MGLPPDDYPTFPTFENVDFYPFPVPDVIEMVSQTLFSSSTDEAKSVLNGVFLEIGDNFLKMYPRTGTGYPCAGKR